MLVMQQPISIEELGVNLYYNQLLDKCFTYGNQDFKVNFGALKGAI